MTQPPLRQWLSRSNIYEVNLRQYTAEGTITAFIPHLPRLKNMGVEILWLMPVQPIAQKKKKGTMGSPYACTDYTAINPQLGNLDDFKQLVQETQRLGMKLIIDWVANHTGWDHRWTTEHKDWYKWDAAKNDFYAAPGMDDIIELNYDNPELVQGMIEAMKFWITECGIDGFRCDLASWVRLSFWQAAHRQLQPVKPLVWLGEFDAGDHPLYMQVFDTAYTWTWMHRSKELFDQKAPAQEWKAALQKTLAAPGLPLWFTTNHDENSWNGTEYEKYGAAASALAVLSALLPGLPLIYSGQEIPNHKRLQFFEKDALDWSKGLQLEQFYKTLLELRRTHPALSGGPAGNFRFITTNQEAACMAIERTSGKHRVVAIFNFSEKEQRTRLQGIATIRTKNVFTGAEFTLHDGVEVVLPSWGYFAYST